MSSSRSFSSVVAIQHLSAEVRALPAEGGLLPDVTEWNANAASAVGLRELAVEGGVHAGHQKAAVTGRVSLDQQEGTDNLVQPGTCHCRWSS